MNYTDESKFFKFATLASNDRMAKLMIAIGMGDLPKYVSINANYIYSLYYKFNCDYNNSDKTDQQIVDALEIVLDRFNKETCSYKSLKLPNITFEQMFKNEIFREYQLFLYATRLNLHRSEFKRLLTMFNFKQLTIKDLVIEDNLIVSIDNYK